MADIIYNHAHLKIPIPSNQKFVFGKKWRKYRMNKILWWEEMMIRILIDTIQRLLHNGSHFHIINMETFEKILRIRPHVRKFLQIDQDKNIHIHDYIEYAATHKGIQFVSFSKIMALKNLHQLEDQEKEIKEMVLEAGNVIIIERCYLFLQELIPFMSNRIIDPKYEVWKRQLKDTLHQLKTDFYLADFSWTNQMMPEFAEHTIRAILSKRTTFQMISTNDQVRYIYFY